MLSCLVMVVESSIFLMASKIFRCTLDEFFFRADIEGTFCDEHLVEYSGGGSVFNAIVVDRVLVIVGRDSRIGVDVNVVISRVF